jgi:hypothetical protein
MDQDEQHLRLLSIFHYVCAGMAAFVGCIPIIHLVLGLVMVFRPEAFGPPKVRPPEFFGWFMVLLAGAFILCAWIFAVLLVSAGRFLARRKRYTFCLVVAGIACLFMPFGTVLGVFSILVLIRPSVKTLFEIPGQPALAT